MLALQALYEIDCVDHKIEDVLRNLKSVWKLPDEAMSFATELTEGVLKKKKEIDEIIKRFAPAWPLEQISTIDRNILRLAIFEILLNNGMPPKGAINEAVELAKIYGSENSAKFVNGVLGSVFTALCNTHQNNNLEGR